MKEEASLARKIKQEAISTGSPALAIGESLPKVSTCLFFKLDTIRGVQTGPGATALTRMFLSTKDAARERVNDTIAPLEAA